MLEVLSVVERGWRGARECSLVLQRHGIKVTHVIKGRLSPDLQRVIVPYPLIRLIVVPRVLFRPCLWAALIAASVRGRLGWLILDHERTLREVSGWCRAFGITPVLIEERASDYRLLRDGSAAAVASVFGLPDRRGESA